MDGSVNGSVSGQMNFGGDGSVVTVTTKQHTGVNIVDIVVDNVTYHVYAPEPDSITISDLLTEGTKIGRITINNVNYDIYAPTGGGGSDVSVIPLLDQGTEIASITVDGNTAHIYAPTPQTVSASAQYNTGTLVGSINISGNITYFYIPDYGADITALDNRLDTAEDNITSLTGRVETAEDNITSLTGRVGTAEGNITGLTTRMGTAEGNITSLGNRMGTAEGNITNLAGRMTEAETDITALGIECDAIAADLAAPYDEESTYSVGDYCTYNKVLYQCNTAISTAEEWDSTHWTDVKVTEDISDIKQSLSVKETVPSFNTQAITDSASDPSFIQKSGNTVTVFLNFSASATVTAWSTLIGTLPSGYRPPKTIFPLGKIGNNIATLRVGSDGGILSSVGMSSGNSANISFTFMTS